MMDDFKKTRTLYEDQSKCKTAQRGAPLSKSTKSKTSKCEHHDQDICEISKEAIKLGLREDAITCSGNIPPDCKIRQDLAAGKTLQEIYKK